MDDASEVVLLRLVGEFRECFETRTLSIILYRASGKGLHFLGFLRLQITASRYSSAAREVLLATVVMKLFVKLYKSSDYHAVPCKEDETVSNLLSEVAKRINDVAPGYRLRLVSVGGGAILFPSDKIRDVLNDGDYLIVG